MIPRCHILKLKWKWKTFCLQTCSEGLHDEEGTQTEELDRALVCPSPQLAVLLRLRRPPGEKRRNHPGPSLLRRGSQCVWSSNGRPLSRKWSWQTWTWPGAQTPTFTFRFNLFQPGLGLKFVCVFFLSFSLWQIKKEGNACSSSSAVIKALRSVPQTRRRSRNGFKVFVSAL